MNCKEYLRLKRAFGKFRKIKARESGHRVAAKYLTQHRWFACDCTGDVKRPPILYPHAKNGIQREPSKRNVPHADDCDFAKYPEQQTDVVLSYKSPAATRRPRRLVPPFVRAQTNDRPSPKSVSSARKRPGLARLLVEILETCQLQHLDASSRKESDDRLQEQIELIKGAARSIYLDEHQPLSNWIATSFTEYMNLRSRLDAEQTDWANGRPHGIYIDAFSRISDTTLYRDEENNVPYIDVDGHLYIYGGYEAARVPYLAICLVAKPTAKEKPRVVRAYTHPCLSKTHFALFDSALEKETLDQIIDCKTYLESFGLDVSILKPLSDMGPRSVTERPVCIPDFVVKAEGPLVRNATVVIETMGYQTKVYRDRKREMKKWFHTIGSSKGRTTPVVKHDREGKTDSVTTVGIDQKFWTHLRNMISDARGPRRYRNAREFTEGS